MRAITARSTQSQSPASGRALSPNRSILSGVGAFVAVLMLVSLTVVLFSGRLGFGPGAYHFSGPPRYSFPGTQGLFASVSMVSPTEGWALAQITKTPRGTQPLDEVTFYHYLNGTWTPVTVKTSQDFSVGGVSGFNGTISMDSPSDGWAVAHNFNQVSVLLRYAHGVWNEVPTSSDLYLDRLQTLSPRSVWALAGQYNQAAIVHYDGNKWTPQTIGGLPAGSQAHVVDYHMLSDKEGWALVALGSSESVQYAVVHDTNGTWTVHSTFNAGQFADFGSLAMVSPTEGWALGQKIVADSHGVTAHVPLKQVLYHYTNGRWSETPLSIGGLPYPTLEQIVMLSPAEGWIVGAQQASYPGATVSQYQQHTIMLHYVGGQWTQVQVPQTNTPVDAITALAFTPDGRAWACGYVSNVPASQVVQDTDILAQASPLLWSLQGNSWTMYQQ
jgi:hypothetical protein